MAIKLESVLPLLLSPMTVVVVMVQGQGGMLQGRMLG
jgi:hypothetical protein